MSRRAVTRRSFATAMVLWAVALVALLVAPLQQTAWRQAVAGRKAVGQVRAKWAARAGVEAAITTIAYNTIDPDVGSTLTILYDLENVADGSLSDTSFVVEHLEVGQLLAGPADTHAKININLIDTETLLELPFMTEDVADAILDWIDDDDDTRALGAELGYYLGLRYPYLPRNAGFRTIAELELISGVDAEYVRGEDWNLNGLLDDNENDGNASWPPDNGDGILEQGWAEYLTAATVDGGYGFTGEPRLSLNGVDPGELADVCGLDQDQAEVIAEFAASGSGSMEQLIAAPLATLTGGDGAQPIDPRVDALSDDQLAAVLDETVFDRGLGLQPGKINLNTCDEELFDYLPAVDTTVADEIILLRRSRAEGIVSLADLLTIPSMNRQTLATLYAIFTVRSNVFTVTSRGRDERTGARFECVATLDRRELPVVIRELRIP